MTQRHLAEALLRAHSLLVRDCAQRGSDKEIYICFALERALQKKWISFDEMKALKGEIFRRLHPHPSLAAWLHTRRELHESCKDYSGGGYDLYDNKYIVLRDDFINGIVRDVTLRELEAMK